MLTTGTGSGKSLSYIVPIVDRVLRARQAGDRQARVRAIIVYPMNALANSQLWELEKYLRNGYGPGREPVTFARYTGQESQADRDRIRANPPDILLTNYVMLELMLTRPDDRRSLIRMARGLEFLVFDELHTYRGRQGADVALLIRRVKDACEAGERAVRRHLGHHGDRGHEPAAAQGRRRRRLPGLRHPRRRGERHRGDPHPRDRRGRRPGHARADRRARRARRAMATWSATRSPAGSRPRSASTATTRASSPAARRPPSSGRPATWRPRPARTRTSARRRSSAPCRPGPGPGTRSSGRPLFAFRLHQFLSKGDTVYVTLEDENTRHITRDYQVEQPGSGGKVLLPLAFCRECGQEYLVAWRRDRSGTVTYLARRDATVADEDGGGRAAYSDGYLYVSSRPPVAARPGDGGRRPARPRVLA